MSFELCGGRPDVDCRVVMKHCKGIIRSKEIPAAAGIVGIEDIVRGVCAESVLDKREALSTAIVIFRSHFRLKYGGRSRVQGDFLPAAQ